MVLKICNVNMTNVNIKYEVTLGGLFVAVGYGGNIWTATDPSGTWTEAVHILGTPTLQAVHFNGLLYVTVGSSGFMATSPDGADWTPRTSSFGSTQINCVTYAAGVWVAGGSSGKLATSTDGITWTQRTTGHNDRFLSIDHDGTQFVATGDQGASPNFYNSYYATDPTSTWTPVQLAGAPPGGAGSLYDVSFSKYGSDGNWVACLSGSKYNASSVDGFYTTTDPTSSWTFNDLSADGVDNPYLNGLYYDSSIWIASGVVNTATSPNTRNWATASDPAGTWTVNTQEVTDSTSTMNDVVKSGSYYVCTGASGGSDIYYTLDPTSTWTRNVLTTGTTFRGITV